MLNSLSHNIFNLIVASIIFALSINTSYAAPTYRGMTVPAGISDESIQALAQYGANVMQYQLTDGSADTHTVAEYLTWLDSALATLDTAINTAATYNMKVIINLHTPPGGYVSRQSPPRMRIFYESEFQNALDTVWTTIATRYASNTTVLGYQLVSEPATPKTVSSGLKNWATLAASLITTVRQVDTTHDIYVQAPFGDQTNLFSAPISNDPGVVYSIDYYYPASYVQQGVYHKYGKKYPSNTLNKAALKKRLNKTLALHKKYNVRIYIGEFSVFRGAKGAPKYLADAISLFESFTSVWTYHAWREASHWDLELVSNKNSDATSPTVTDRGKVIKKYFKKNK